jgi:predicted carbohydrate-binding protein with CBM5 and CBM33 domain
MNTKYFLLASFFLGSLLSNQQGFAHGYVNVPESRSFLCNQGGNANCGAIQYEPQSVEGPDGFPQSGASDEQIAAGGQPAWSPLNEQSATRWQKRVIKSGRTSFSWHFTANHVTKDWKYYITKPNWNPEQKLTRQSFDLEPFCVVDGGMQRPPVDVTHDCVVPDRQGYHIILALWDVGDTTNTFYQVIDVQVDGSSNGGIVEPEPNAPSPDQDPTRPGQEQPDGAGSQPDKTDCQDSGYFQPQPGDRLCQAVAGSGADDQWCNVNCNHEPSFCPASFCQCN